MIVENFGYKKYNDVLKMLYDKKHFCIYKTHKNTVILVFEPTEEYNEKIDLVQPKWDRLPYKITEGKSIIKGTKIFDSYKNNKQELKNTLSLWNGKNQIMTYGSNYESWSW